MAMTGQKKVAERYSAESFKQRLEQVLSEITGERWEPAAVGISGERDRLTTTSE
jgi:hypothetical protein